MESPEQQTAIGNALFEQSQMRKMIKGEQLSVKKTDNKKFDDGKSPVRRGLLEYFPRACMAVADVSAFGASIHGWGSWHEISDAVARYGDAELRHICYASIEGKVASDSKLHHAAHEAWNALARLELLLREEKQ